MVTSADQRHLFSFASEVYDLYRNQDGTVDFNPDISDTYDRISPNEEQVCIPYYDIDTKWRSVTVGNPSQLLIRHERLNSDDSQSGKRVHLERKSISNIHGIEVSPTDELSPANKYRSDRPQETNHDVRIPEEPFLLFLSHFETCVPFRHFSDLIERTFEEFPEISYEFVAEECLVSEIYLLFFQICDSSKNSRLLSISDLRKIFLFSGMPFI